MIQQMARRGGNKILSSPCFSKINLFYISLFLSIPCLSFIYSLWLLLISIPILLLSTLLHVTLFNKKPANPGFRESSVQQGTPKFRLQNEVTDQETEKEAETTHEVETELETAESNNEDDEELEKEEEGLIEIVLAGEAKQEKLDTVMKSLAESGLMRQDEEEMIMEIWAEVEEENFIEIDISMGSTASL